MYPLDFIRGLLGTKISVSLRDGSEHSGVLRMFDEHINIIMTEIQSTSSSDVLFLRSENILSISEI